MGSFAGKLTSVQNNEAESWLPESAESTQAIQRLEEFQDPNDLVTTVVYYKESGLTEEDLAAIEEHATEIDELEGVIRTSSRRRRAAAAGIPAPYVSEDGQVAKLDFTINRGDELWEEHARRRRRDPRHHRDRRRRGLPRRRRWHHGRPGRGVRGHGRPAAADHAAAR